MIDIRFETPLVQIPLFELKILQNTRPKIVVNPSFLVSYGSRRMDMGIPHLILASGFDENKDLIVVYLLTSLTTVITQAGE